MQRESQQGSQMLTLSENFMLTLYRALQPEDRVLVDQWVRSSAPTGLPTKEAEEEFHRIVPPPIPGSSE
jgi:hypothetical protein